MRHSSRNYLLRRILIAALILCLFAASLPFSFRLIQRLSESEEVAALRQVEIPTWIEVDLIGINGAARRGTSLELVGGIVIHYIGNPATTATQNRNYFDNPDTTVSAHFVIGLEGEIIQCVPLNEKSSASNHRNADTISIEVCHPDETGVFTDASYRALVRLSAWLCHECGLDTEAIIRHYDVTGKTCPRWFVEDEEAWEKFRRDVASALEKGEF